MREQTLLNYRILIVEDEYLLAEDLREELTRAGAIVVGMTSTVKDALALIEAEGKLDAAIIDVNLGGTPGFPIADRLSERQVPFVFATGYDPSAIPARFRDALRCEKPFSSEVVLRSIKQVIQASATPR
jgi:DNA-binding response OmpR family regulator